jgi:hypothetical protein
MLVFAVARPDSLSPLVSFLDKQVQRTPCKVLLETRKAGEFEAKPNQN